MIRFSHYRTFALASALALALPACDTTPHKDMHVEQRTKWDLTKIGVLYQLALQQYQVGDYDKCRQTLAQIFATTAPHAPSHILAAKVDLEKGSLENAAAHLKTAVQIDPNYADAYYMLGVTYQPLAKHADRLRLLPVGLAEETIGSPLPPGRRGNAHLHGPVR